MNNLNIVTCEFVNVIGDQKTGEVTRGYRIYDAYSMTYGNTWETVPSDELEILKAVFAEADEIAKGMFDFVRSEEMGIYVNGNYLKWDEIKSVFGDDETEDDPALKENEGLL